MEKMNETELTKHGKVEAKEPRGVCWRLCWTPPRSLFFPDYDLSKGLFPWLASIFLWDYILDARNLVLSHHPTLLSPFLGAVFPNVYSHTLIAFTGAVFVRESRLPP